MHRPPARASRDFRSTIGEQTRRKQADCRRQDGDVRAGSAPQEVHRRPSCRKEPNRVHTGSRPNDVAVAVGLRPHKSGAPQLYPDRPP
eukprot:1794776-Prymnesium_polylepis.1